ncbi:MAG: pyridoxamine 5'-phosphate oxidase family protein [Helicobacteraceae bacterium]|jgi:nitroimidazol reductase NimA-like FMN-containing flavoprotein (pyridoxamine 5'-phosphate oxidase superfamily)|nr:pyridoxamine 5'-phosphate oxidase family protein [Helicobacteraceae bacterium]
MEQLRYQRRICTDTEKIDAFLARSRVGILGLNAGEYPYATPINYIWLDKKIYFHGAGSGKRQALLQEEPSVCFTVYEEYGTVKDKLPCRADTAYFSVMIFGKAQKVKSAEESAAALRHLTEKFMPGFYKDRLSLVSADYVNKYRSSLDGNLASIHSITPDHISAKENDEEPDKLFKSGESL